MVKTAITTTATIALENKGAHFKFTFTLASTVNLFSADRFAAINNFLFPWKATV